MLFAMLLGMVFTLSVDRGGQFLAASGRAPAGDCVLGTLATALAGSAVGMFVGYLLIGSGLEFFERASESSFRLALLLVPLNTVSDSLVLLFMGMRKFAWMGRVSIVRVAGHLIATLALVWGAGMGVGGAITALMIGNSIAIAVAFWLLARSSVLSGSRVHLSQCRSMLSYGSRYWIANLSNQVQFRVGTIILAWFATSSEIGLFAAAAGLVSRVQMVPDAVEGALLSRVARDPSGRPELVARLSRISVMICGVGLLVLVALSKPIVQVLFSSSFIMAVPLVWVMSIGILIRCGSKVIVPYFMGMNRPQLCSWAIAAGVGVNLAALLVLLPRIGLTGAAWAMTLGYVTSTTILVVAFANATGTKMTDAFLPRRSDVGFIGDLLKQHLARRRESRD
jgi:O-antigen/teichoic acid export membrane protein